jgi:hypothetical protein
VRDEIFDLKSCNPHVEEEWGLKGAFQREIITMKNIGMENIKPNLQPKYRAINPAEKGKTAAPMLPAENVSPRTVLELSGYNLEREVTRGVPNNPVPIPKMIHASKKKLKFGEMENKIIPIAPMKILRVSIFLSPKLSVKIPAGN